MITTTLKHFLLRWFLAHRQPRTYEGRVHAITQSQHFPLSRAYLCANCGVVGDSAKACPGCACTTALLGLAAILDKEDGENRDYGACTIFEYTPDTNAALLR